MPEKPQGNHIGIDIDVLHIAEIIQINAVRKNRNLLRQLGNFLEQSGIRMRNETGAARNADEMALPGVNLRSIDTMENGALPVSEVTMVERVYGIVNDIIGTKNLYADFQMHGPDPHHQVTGMRLGNTPQKLLDLGVIVTI
ncbi:MAG TPA: hypothetical protein VLC91_15930 [Spongiibacteraceae bacterium]|nr:hypothetical protein [Spongiibacteraceae bacterium]